MLKITIDKDIYKAKEFFTPIAKIQLLEGRKITQKDLIDSNALIIRTTTKVNRSLLENTPIQFVGTATAGFDHIDLKYLKKNHIAFAHAKGANSNAVAEYILTALFYLHKKQKIKLDKITLGIIGFGNIGKKLASKTKALGIKTIINDPPLKDKTNDFNLISLSEILQSDVISIHIPYTQSGKYPTKHLFDKKTISKLKKNCIIINTSRGGIIDEIALIHALERHKIRSVIIDTWENEPYINTQLLNLAYLATPHIAGYTQQGKQNATQIIYQRLCSHFKLKNHFLNSISLNNQTNNFISNLSINSLKKIFEKKYDIEKDSNTLKFLLTLPTDKQPEYFDQLRNNYNFRKEFSFQIFR